MQNHSTGTIARVAKEIPGHNPETVQLHPDGKLLRVLFDIVELSEKEAKRGKKECIKNMAERAREAIKMLQPDSAPPLDDRTRDVAHLIQFAVLEIEGMDIEDYGFRSGFMGYLNHAHRELTGLPLFQKIDEEGETETTQELTAIVSRLRNLSNQQIHENNFSLAWQSAGLMAGELEAVTAKIKKHNSASSTA